MNDQLERIVKLAKKMAEDIKEFENGKADLIDVSKKLEIVINFADKAGILPEHCFTFEDGETWWAEGHDPNG